MGQEDPLEKGMATHSSILAWRIPWTEETDGLPSTGSQRDTIERLTGPQIFLRSLSNPKPAPWGPTQVLAPPIDPAPSYIEV